MKPRWESKSDSTGELNNSNSANDQCKSESVNTAKSFLYQDMERAGNLFEDYNWYDDESGM